MNFSSEAGFVRIFCPGGGKKTGSVSLTTPGVGGILRNDLIFRLPGSGMISLNHALHPLSCRETELPRRQD